MNKIRLTETQRVVLRCSIDGMVVVRRRDTMLKLVALGLVTPDTATMTERLKVGRLTAEGRRIAAAANEDPFRTTFEIAPSFARIRLEA